MPSCHERNVLRPALYTVLQDSMRLVHACPTCCSTQLSGMCCQEMRVFRVVCPQVLIRKACRLAALHLAMSASSSDPNWAGTQTRAVALLSQAAALCDDDTRLQRVVPYLLVSPLLCSRTGACHLCVCFI